MKKDDKNLKYLKDHLITICDLPEFIETEGGVDLKWNRDEEAVCACPLPDHYETKPSFHVSNLDGVWVYHCFGCQKKGTIIHFCMDMFGLKNQIESIKYLCKYYNVKDVDDLILQGLKNVSKKISFDKQIENENVLVSNQCRMLLRRDFEKNKSWVIDAYNNLNLALDEQNFKKIQEIGHQAFNRLNN